MIARRHVLLGSALLAASARSVAAYAKRPDPFADETLYADVVRYAGFGNHQTGGPGDVATGQWLGEQLTLAGLTVTRQQIEAPFFDPASVMVEGNGLRIDAIVQHPVTPTGNGGINGALAMRHSSFDDSALKGKIAVVPLPHARHSSAMGPSIMKMLRATKDAGAIGIIIVTDGPTGDAIALNVEPDAGFAGIPVVVIGTKQAAALYALANAGASGRLLIDGRGGRRAGHNIIATRAGSGPALVISTPLSGWFTCAGERGTGIAAWLAFARWLPRAFPELPLVFAGLVGHEFEYLGSKAFLKQHAPDPAGTRLWIHFGSGFATRDWHEAGALGLLPLPSADPQRFLLASPDILPVIKRAMRGLPGFESTYPAVVESAGGETRTVLEAGYKRVIGNFGNSRFHHTRRDLPETTSGPLIAASATALRDAVSAILASPA